MRDLLAFILVVAFATSRAQSPEPLSDVFCTVSLVMQDCQVEVTLTGNLLLNDSAFLGFYSGCFGHTGVPVQIAPGEFEVSLVYHCWQSPLWLTPDLWENYGEPGYPCYEELGLSLCSDSTNWWTIDPYDEEFWHGLIAESNVPFQQSFNLDGSSGFQWPINVAPGNGSLCGEGTIWDGNLEQCVAILQAADTIFVEPDACVPSCGEGTLWDPINEECVVAIPADINFDGCVTVNDLLVLLAIHGTCPPYPEWPDEPSDTTWTCGDPVTYWDHDYPTVLIGDQCWFSENLRTPQYRNGADIPVGLDDASWSNTQVGATSIYGEGASDCFGACDPIENLDWHGRLYNFEAVTDVRGLCPSGWQAPTQEDVTLLVNGFGGFVAAAPTLAAEGGYGGFGTGASGLDLLPQGWKNPSGYFSLHEAFFMWTRSETVPNEASYYTMNPSLTGIYSDSHWFGMSVRCVKD